ncbi:MAG: GNAT family N-acetyltransferase [Clostridiales bacterium]|nr:GNAT family N-acetyltransferase [Clostridiales bacterium]
MKIVYKDIPPKLEEYLKIREEVNFVKLEQRIAKNGLENSAYIVSAYDGERLVGLARLISDGGYVNFISDVIVHPKYQLKGIGKNLVEMILEHLQKNLIEGEKIAVYLMSAKNKEAFYKGFGFEAHPNAKKGSGMSLWLEG